MCVKLFNIIGYNRWYFVYGSGEFNINYVVGMYKRDNYWVGLISFI